MLEKKWKAAAIDADGETAFILDNDHDTKEEAEKAAARYALKNDRWTGAVECTYTWPEEAARTINPTTSESCGVPPRDLFNTDVIDKNTPQ
jgi:hypothetical protein